MRFRYESQLLSHVRAHQHVKVSFEIEYQVRISCVKCAKSHLPHLPLSNVI